MNQINAISDSWSDSCLYINNKYIQGIASNLHIVFSFDFYMTVGFLILILFPLLLKIYAFGLQQRLRMFYDHSRILFIYLIFLCCFSQAICTMIHLLVQQPMPCAKWDGNQLLSFHESSRTPNVSIVLLFLLFIFFLSIDIEMKLFCIIITFFLFALYSIFAIINGDSSILQVIVSSLLAVWIFSIHKLIPPIGTLLISFILPPLLIIEEAVEFSKLNWSLPLMKTAFRNSFQSTLGLLISGVLLIRFAHYRKHFNLYKTNWRLNTYIWTKTSDAIIPSMAQDNQKDNFADLLKNDLIDGILAFSLYSTGILILFHIQK